MRYEVNQPPDRSCFDLIRPHQKSMENFSQNQIIFDDFCVCCKPQRVLETILCIAGTIYTTAQLDRETQLDHTLFIEVDDQGVPGSLQVRVIRRVKLTRS